MFISEFLWWLKFISFGNRKWAVGSPRDHSLPCCRMPISSPECRGTWRAVATWHVAGMSEHEQPEVFCHAFSSDPVLEVLFIRERVELLAGKADKSK